MYYTVALSNTPGVTNIIRNPKGKPLCMDSLWEAEWRAWLSLHSAEIWEETLPSGKTNIIYPYVEVRQHTKGKRKEVILRWVLGPQRSDGTHMTCVWGKPGKHRFAA